MVLELKDKVRDLLGDDAPAITPAADDDLVAALLNLGYKRNVVDRAVAAVDSEGGGADMALPEKLKAALRRLSRV
jgi:Holliday junction resolvasome RuvABC DNA-binding subunit